MDNLLLLAMVLLVSDAVSAQESTRIKRKPPTPEEAARTAADFSQLRFF